MDIKDVEKIASLARLGLTDTEKEKYTSQLVKILDYIDQLKELDTENVPPIGQPLMDKLNLAEDNVSEFKSFERLTAIAPDFRDGFFRVKKVIE